MAPVLAHLDIPDLKYSSLELDSRSSTPATSLPASPVIKRSLLPDSLAHNPLNPINEDASPILSPMDTFNVLTARDAKTTVDPNPGAGSIDPNDINMKGIQALFALIGAAFVIGGIWFFFWAKNGGFKWRKGDWEEYKSTVLRRKGPNGTTLSNATKSTILGGGSVVGEGYSDKDAATTIDGTMTETMTDMSSEAPIIKETRSKKSKAKKESAKERKLREINEAQWEGAHDDDVRAYRHEKAARVGGINKDSDALFYGTDYTETERSASDMASNSNRQSSAYGGEAYRKSSRQSSPEKRQSRRDFSFSQEETFSVSSPPPAATAAPQGPRPSRYQSPRKNPGPQRPIRNVPGSFTQPLDFDVQSQNTKSYHHPLPSLNGQGRTGGYRRDRRDSLDD
ncbi:hypothetical protein ABEF95_004565 [Exophiala dermatitidis]